MVSNVFKFEIVNEWLKVVKNFEKLIVFLCEFFIIS